jgi:hypothetical protein
MTSTKRVCSLCEQKRVTKRCWGYDFCTACRKTARTEDEADEAVGQLRGTYKLALSASDQLDMEEQIASAIFECSERVSSGEDCCTLGEEDSAQLGRDILKMVLQRFRIDLVHQ